jgi:hypothetical protein
VRCGTDPIGPDSIEVARFGVADDNIRMKVHIMSRVIVYI